MGKREAKCLILIYNSSSNVLLISSFKKLIPYYVKDVPNLNIIANA